MQKWEPDKIAASGGGFRDLLRAATPPSNTSMLREQFRTEIQSNKYKLDNVYISAFTSLVPIPKILYENFVTVTTVLQGNMNAKYNIILSGYLGDLSWKEIDSVAFEQAIVEVVSGSNLIRQHKFYFVYKNLVEQPSSMRGWAPWWRWLRRERYVVCGHVQCEGCWARAQLDHGTHSLQMRLGPICPLSPPSVLHSNGLY